jgi:hypothetical protein
MRPVVLLIIGAIVAGRSFAQPTDCPAQRLTMKYLQEQGSHAHGGEVRSPLSGMRGGGIALLPVVVHVVWNTPSENVPDVAILSLIDQLNADCSAANTDLVYVRTTFQSVIGDAQVAYCLAQVDPLGNATSGITRTMTSETWFDPDTEPDAMKSAPLGVDAWDPQHYLNIWICDISSGGGGTAGYAYLPVGGIPGSSVDGVVLDYDLGVGPTTRTATHEVGHYLGLLHPWGVDGGCLDDDGFMDTPLTSGPTLSCADTTWQTCGQLVQYENFMDRSPCRIMFSAEQAAYMASILDTVRTGLTLSTACTGAGIPRPEGAQFSFLIHQGSVTVFPFLAGPYEVSLLDARGRELEHAKVMSGSYHRTLFGIAPGAYFLRALGSNARGVSKLFIGPY